MSRRAEMESVLSRYGEQASYGGETFRAILRPDNFHFSSGATAENMSFLYIGPAAHKLVPGGTVESGGMDYTVRRCETVRISGEELYVRAALTLLSPASGTAVKLMRDGKVFAGALSCTALAVQDAEAVVPWGGNNPAGIEEGAATWKLTLEGIQVENNKDLLSPEPFSISVTCSGRTAVYTGCLWKRIERTDSLNTAGFYTGKALALGREAEENER